MSERDLIAQTVALAGGEITGRVRLQKVMYLLSKLGLQRPLPYAYHYFGPYSRAVDEAISEAKAFCGLQEMLRQRAVDGASFSVFKLDQPALNLPIESLGGIPVQQAETYIKAMIAVPSTVIEIAATIYWLRHDENVEDWEAELDVRKGAKAKSGRTERALELLSELGLETVAERV